MITTIALVIFFILTGLRDFGVTFNYWDLLRGITCFVIVLSFILGNTTGL